MNELTINLHTASETPLYEQIYQHIKREIQEGRITSGEKLPSSRSLCKYLEVSRSTVELAYEQLISEGYVEAVPCKGYFAAELEGMYRLDVVPALVGAEEKTEKKGLFGKKKKDEEENESVKIGRASCRERV